MKQRYRLILVDDEKAVIRGIQKVFDLPSLGFELEGTYQNPETALAEISETRPDLVITDIKMPQMDGLQLAGAVKKQFPNAEIVLFSGYSDFAYAQQAVKLGVSDYITKPIKKSAFIAMMQEMYRRIDEKKKNGDYFQYLQEFAIENQDELKNKFFMDLAEDEMEDPDSARTVFDNLKPEFDFDTCRYFLVQVHIARLPEGADEVSLSGEILQRLLAALSGLGKEIFFQDDENLFLMLHETGGNAPGEAKRIAEEFCRDKAAEGIRLTPGISSVKTGLQQFFCAASETRRAIYMSEMNLSDSASGWNILPEKGMEMPYAVLEDFFRAISIGDREGGREALAQLYRDDHGKTNALYLDYCSSISFLIILRMFAIEGRYNPDRSFLDRKLLKIKVLEREYPSAEAQKKLIDSLADQLSELMNSEEGQQSSRVVNLAMEYIDKNYEKNLSIQEISDNIGISKNYLCNLFKKELNTTVIHYMTNVRIDKAKKLLTDTGMKMADISKAVGFNDYTYFSQLFKRNTGSTLSAWRKAHTERNLTAHVSENR